MARRQRDLRDLFGPLGNGVLANGGFRVAIELERNQNNAPVAVQIREIHPAQRQPGALLQPPPLINEFWIDNPSPELVNQIFERNLMQPDFYGPPINQNFDYDRMDRMDEDDDELPPGVRDRRHSPKRKVVRKRKSPNKKASPKKRKSPKKKASPKKVANKKTSPKRQSGKTSCPLSDLKKYTNRPSPPRPANDPGCRDQIHRGNDGLLYASVPNKNGVYRWVKF